MIFKAKFKTLPEFFYQVLLDWENGDGTTEWIAHEIHADRKAEAVEVFLEHIMRAERPARILRIETGAKWGVRDLTEEILRAEMKERLGDGSDYTPNDAICHVAPHLGEDWWYGALDNMDPMDRGATLARI